ncbi:hypothetical protein V5O48_012329 [Marasmius crinis-equi]|uniref:Enoyl reductase (ER) domain-containing protein n=1 Tax=Marasmius crinis-equi TaxID=585013 RepID=A0ABR3F338_9AGAR
MSQQKALVVPARGSPYTLITKPIPISGPAEVLIKLEGIGLNQFEWYASHVPAFFDCFDIGTSDGAGVVEAVGSEVKGFKKGGRIVFQGFFFSDYSTYQQYALSPKISIAKLPPTISTLEASSIRAALVTAANGFCQPNPALPSSSYVGEKFDCPGRAGAAMKPFWEDGAEGIKAGEPMIVLGGSSSVGQLVIQISKYLGFSPIITTSSLKHAEYLKSLGATHVLDRHTPDESLVRTIRDIVHDKPIQLAWDAIGAIMQAHIELLGPDGVFVLANPRSLTPQLVFTDGRKGVVPNGAVHAFKELGEGLFGSLESLLARGVIKPTRVEKVPGGLSGILEGHAKMQKNEVSGAKLVVDPTETP